MAGTPGVGKSRICAEIAKKCSMKWQDVSKIAKDKGYVEEYDENLECPVLDEDKVSVEMKFSKKQLVIDRITQIIFYQHS